MPRSLFIVGTTSRRGREAAAALRGLDGDVRLLSRPGEAEELARRHAGAYDTLAAVGGDGTVCEVATGLIASGADARLAILPAGTGNDAAHGFGIHSWEDGVAFLSGESERRVDVIEAAYQCEGAERRRLCLVGAGIGFPSAVASRATRRVKRVLGPWAYYYGAFAEALAYRCPTLRVEANGHTREGPFILVAVVNTERTSRQTMRMAPGARVDDGLLDVLLVSGASKLRLLANIGRLREGTHVDLPEVEHLTATAVLVDGPPAPLMIDGDSVGVTPAAFRVLPAALRVRVP